MSENLYKLCSVDLETLGTRPGDVILSIGACLFDKERGIYSEFYCTIDPQSCRAAGLRATKSTIEWWQKEENAAARAEAFKGQTPLKEALEKFAAWLPKDTLVYGNGANFDNALLSAAYRAVGLEQPWPFWMDRCFRTLKNMFLTERVEFEGIKHHALHDAKDQAKCMINMQKCHGFELK